MKEIVKHRIKQTSLSIVQNKIQAIRKKEIQRTGCRIIKNNKISVAGCLGEADEAELFAKAEQYLPESVDYLVSPTQNVVHTTDLSDFEISDAQLCERIENLLRELKDNHPDFAVSNKVNLSNINLSISNENGLKLNHSDSFLTLSLLLKENTSSSIMDTFFGITERNLNENKVITTINEILTAYKNKLDFTKTPMPVIIDQSTLTQLFLRDLNGKLLGNKASLFQGQIGEQIFSDKFTLKISNTPKETFSPIFDMEGTIAPDNLLTLVKSGKIIRPYTDKRTAAKFGFDNTGCASGGYDSVPTLGACALEIEHSGKTLKELLDGKMGIMVAIASGGDFTPEGHFASPVQVAFLTDGEKLIGRLPELSISGSILDFFGKDFVGVSSNKIYSAGDERLAVVNLDVKKLA